VPASDRSDDLVRIGSPFEGFGLDVVLFEKLTRLRNRQLLDEG
jgi:hypothetical protein